MAIELATAYVSIVPSTKNFERDIKKALKGAGDFTVTPKVSTRGTAAAADDFMGGFSRRAGALAHKTGDRIGNMLVNGMKKAALAGAATIATTIGTILFKGINRYMSLDKARAQLEALGKSATEIQQIMRDVESVVKGTPIALQDAFGVVSMLLASGVEQGNEMKTALQSIADAAGFSGQAFSDLATVFLQVQNKGKLMAEELLQFHERNIPLRSWLAKSLGVDPAQVDKLISDGKVTSDMVFKAVEDNAAGFAQRMGNTIQGAFDNMLTALGRLGNNILSIIFGDPTKQSGDMVAALDSITAKLDEVNAWVSNNGPDIIGFFANLAMASVTMAQTVVGSFTYITRGIGWFVNIIGDTLGGINKVLSGINRLLGRGEIADQLAADAEAMFGLGDGLLDAANASDQAFKSLDKMFWSIADWKGDAQQAAAFTRDLGKAIVEVGDKDVILKAPTPEDIAAIDEAKWKILEIPDSKDVIIRPKTQEAAAEINSFREAEGKKPLIFMADPNLAPAVDEMEAFRRAQEANPVIKPVDADTTRAQATLDAFIGNAISTTIKLPVDIGPGIGPGAGTSASSPGPGFIGPGGATPAPSRAPGGGQGYPTRTFTGPGFIGNAATPTSTTGGVTPGQIDSIASQFGLTKTSGSRPGDSGYHGSGQAGDYSGSVTDMQAFAAYMSQNFGSSLAEVIFDAPGWAGNIKDGSVVGPFGNVYTMDQAGYHGDHVHIAWAKFDQGGWWPNNIFGLNTTGKPEYVLTPEQLEELRKQGIDPATIAHGTAQGAPPGPADWIKKGAEAVTTAQGRPPGPPPQGGRPPTPTDEQIAAQLPGRTEGYIPAGASFTGTTGGGLAGGLINLGAEAINSLIDQAVSMAAAAASMTPAGPGGSAAASMALGLGAEAAKRGVKYAAEMAGIGIGALTEQLFPFGAPRWLSDVDATSFIPQMGITPAAVTSGEKALQESVTEQQGTEHGTRQGAPPGPEFPQPPGLDYLAKAVAAVPEPQLPPAQPPMVNVENITTTDAEAVGASIAKGQRLLMLQYSGRP